MPHTNGIDDFFSPNYKFKRIYVSGGQTDGIVIPPKESELDQLPELQPKGRDQSYAAEYQAAEQKAMYEAMMRLETDKTEEGAVGGKMSDIDSSVGQATNLGDFTMEEVLKVYDNYDFKQKRATVLPITAHRQKIVSVVDINQVTVIQGATGCGKSTQVPQYILDASVAKRLHCNILVTQPRRIAAITVAKRVAYERGWPLGSLVGYQVGLHRQASKDTRLLFCTTGVLLQKLIHAKHMNEYTHVILDEVHERDQDMDFCLLVARRLLSTNSSGVKLILMSATFNSQRFSEYFSIRVKAKLETAPIINLDAFGGRRQNYSVSIFYLNQLDVLGSLPEVRIDEPGISPDTFELAVKLIQGFDRLEAQSGSTSRGAVLVFLPGIHEIEELFKMLKDRAATLKCWVRPLHSTITTEEQEAVFHQPPPGERKVILSTNIAESSITVSDIVYVIDFCRTKQLVNDPATNFSSLQLRWASRTNCVQRAGRAGRVAEGRVYRLVPESFYLYEMEEECEPEMLLAPLDRLVLQAKMLEMGPPRAILGVAMDPPDLCNLQRTVLLLKEAGGLLLHCKGKYELEDGDITFLGRVMARLPVDIYITKLIMMGHIFSLLEECIIIGASMSLKCIFSTPFQRRLEAYNSRLTWADSSCSDCISFLNAYKVWRLSHQNGYFKRSVGGGEAAWASRYYIQLNLLREVSQLVEEIKGRLKQLNIEESQGHGRVVWTAVQRPLVLKIAIAGAFYPHYFVRGGPLDEQMAVKELAGHDPCHTVMLHGLPSDQPGELYARTIKQGLRGCAPQVSVSFDGTSKVYVHFGHVQSQKNDLQLTTDIPGRVSLAVYRAIKIRQLKLPIELHLLEPQAAAERAKQLGVVCRRDNPWSWQNTLKSEPCSRDLAPAALPGLEVNLIPLFVSHVEDPGHFWATRADLSSHDEQVQLYQSLNSGPSVLRRLPDKLPRVGWLYVAPYTEAGETKYYRARLEQLIPRRDTCALARVFFVDYGNRAEMPVSELRDFGRELLAKNIRDIPAQAFECVLAEVRPSLIKNPRGQWTEEAVKNFTNMVMNRTVMGRVYSVVNSVVVLELLVSQNGPPGLDELNVNQWLVNKGLAERAEESYLSKANHERRIQQKPEQGTQDTRHWTLWPAAENEPEPPHPSECYKKVRLRGPCSPLEMKLYSLTRIGQHREVVVEWSSVNSVLLDTEPQDPHERLLVAGSVGQSPDGSRLNLRHTTLMPNIHGLPALLCLLFCPTMELRCNGRRTRYVSGLCGLGSGVSGDSLYPDHDMDVEFDVQIDLEDIETVNRLRYWMSESLRDDGSEEPKLVSVDMLHCQQKVQMFLMQLLIKKRHSQEPAREHRGYKWGMYPKDLLLHPSQNMDENEDKFVYRLHWGLKLEPEDSAEMLEHEANLQKLAQESSLVGGSVTCELCQVTVESTSALSLHLRSSRHCSHLTELKRRHKLNDTRVALRGD